jgi:hypothetical protein
MKYSVIVMNDAMEIHEVEALSAIEAARQAVKVSVVDFTGRGQSQVNVWVDFGKNRECFYWDENGITLQGEYDELGFME